MRVRGRLWCRVCLVNLGGEALGFGAVLREGRWWDNVGLGWEVLRIIGSVEAINRVFGLLRILCEWDWQAVEEQRLGRGGVEA